MSNFSETASTTADYWQTYLRDAEPCSFPQLTNGEASRQQRQRFDANISGDLEALKAYCRRYDVLSSTVLKAAWAVTLSRYAGGEEVGFTLSILDDDGERTGLCRVAVDETSSISKVVEALDMDSIRSRRQWTSSLKEIPSFVQSDGRPLFNSGILIEKTEDGSATSENEETKPSVVLRIRTLGQRASAVLDYSTATLCEAQAASVTSTFSTVLSAAVRNPNKSVRELDLISKHDRALIQKWNAIAPETVNKCAHEIIHRQSKTEPDSLAVDAWDGFMTYQELDQASTRLAHYLRSLGVGPEVIVPLCWEKSLWAIVSLLGVIKAGGVMVFIDPSHPVSRRQEVTKQVDARLVVTSAQQAPLWEASGLQVIVVDRAFINRLPPQVQLPESGVSPQNALYIIFTSGSTGTPKGCVIQHFSFVSGALQQASVANMRSTSRVLQLASYCFDVSILEILTALMSGACVCTPLQEKMTQGLANIINDMQISWAFLTPSLVKTVTPSDVPNLKTLVLGGEALSKANVETWSQKENFQLANGYGPSECSIAAVANGYLKPTTDPANIGTALGGLTWIVDAQDHDKLVSIGAVGELLIEGPILSRGYLHNPEKTAESFVFPAWANKDGLKRRFYKTGDLARYNPDGTVHFVGRKDTQVKLRGLRIELGEIEHHVSVHPHVHHAIIVLPKSGPCKQRLVAVVSLKEFETPATDIRLLEGERKAVADAQISAVRQYVSEHVPTYMVPATWIAVENIPLMISGKMNRTLTARWVMNMDDATYRKIADIQIVKYEELSAVGTVEAQIRSVYSRVLNISESEIPLNKSFLSLGGDSITAMQASARCRQEGIIVSVKDIIRSKTITELVGRVGSAQDSLVRKEELYDTEFALSPVQRMYFDVVSQEAQGETHYNQSFFLRLTRQISTQDFAKALETVVARHSMLRARFSKGPNGKWAQRVLKEVATAYRFTAHSVRSSNDLVPIVQAEQRSLNLQQGPVFAVDFFDVQGTDQLVFLVAHHAVIDLVSWRVIMKDLEEMLTMGSISSESPLPWHAWLELQADYARQYIHPQKALPFEIPAPNYDYWGMNGKPNTIRDSVEGVFRIDSETTARLLGDACHNSLRTEPIDLLLSSLIGSFSRVFSDRKAPPLFREGHGREPWDDSLDLSETVGWFTTMFPIYVDAKATDSIGDIVRLVKDTRHTIPRNGWPYFASRYLNAEGIKTFGHHTQVELSFDYLGLYQQLEREDALLRQEPREQIPASDDVGKDVQRFCLVEITAEVFDGQMQFSFVYNRHMKQQSAIKQWMDECKQWLCAAVAELSNMEHQYTLSDFPLSSLTYSGLDKLISTVLPRIGAATLDDIEDIYPCTSMQAGLLVSQNRAAGTYEYYHTFEVLSSENSGVEVERLKDAWQKIVYRHSSLRTIFIDALGREGLYDQLVLKNAQGRIFHQKCKEADVERVFASQQPVTFRDSQPPHRLIICETPSGKVFCKLEINHAITDGESIPVILRDLGLAYDGKLPLERGPLYSDIVAYQKGRVPEVDMSYWTQYLTGIEPCYFPVIEGTPETQKTGSTEFSVPLAHLQDFCNKNNITVSNLFQAAWGLVLRTYTGAEQVCFGYLSSGRDAPVENIEEAVGAYINMLVCRLDLAAGKTVQTVLEAVQEDFANSLEHQYCSLADIQHALKLSSEPLFNTMMTFRRDGPVAEPEKSSILVKTMEAYDPTEYYFTVDIWASESQATVTLEYGLHNISDAQVANVVSAFEQALKGLLKDSSAGVNDVALFSDHHRAQVQTWNGNVPVRKEQCVHELVEAMAKTRPDAQAICSFDGDYTYRELDTAATHLAHHLVGLGVKSEDLIPMCFDKSRYAIVSMLAVLKAGGACAFLDPTHPIARLTSLVETLESKVLLASPQHAHLFKNMVPHIVSIDQQLFDTLPKLSGPACMTIRPSNAAFVVFTSGTTGKPKGIVSEHRQICTQGGYISDVFGFGPDSRQLQYASYTFDPYISDIFYTLFRGGCVCNISEFDRVNNLAGGINATKANMMDVTVTVASLLRPADVPNLRLVQLGGEAITKEVVNTWADHVNLCNTYGPAEATITTLVKTNIKKGVNDLSLGQGVGCVTWVVDATDHNKLAPVGCIGELLLEGPVLARGYLKDPAKTAAAFILAPKWAGNDASGQPRRFYKTGDLVWYSADGSLNYVGRRDMQLKLNGKRVELGEIEHHTTAILGDKHRIAVDAVTISNSKNLALFLYAPDTKPAGASDRSESLVTPLSPEMKSRMKELQSSLAEVLPAHMVPTLYIALGRVPTSSSGKLDRRRLQQLDLTQAQINHYSLDDSSKKAPSTEMEKTMQVLWSQALGIALRSIGANDNFLRLGGDSVGAMKLVAAARAKNINLTVADVFQSPTLSKMAEAVSSPGVAEVQKREAPPAPFGLLGEKTSAERLIDQAASQCGVDKSLIEDIYPATPLQEGLMAISTRNAGAYVAQKAFVLPDTPEFDLEAFRQAWQSTVSSQSILRTRVIHTKDLGSLQVVLKTPLTWRSAGTLGEYVDHDKAEPITYGGELLRLALFSDGKKHYFVWTSHHALYDGWSMGLLFEQVERTYRGLTELSGVGEKPLEAVPYSYFIRYLQGVNQEASDSFWRAQLSGTTPTSFPRLPSLDYQPKPTQKEVHSFTISRKESSNVTMSTVLRTAWAMVVARYSDSEDVVFAMTLSGRNAPVTGITDMFGPTITTVPMRMRLNYDGTVVEALHSAQQQATDMMPFEHAGLQNIRRLGAEAQAATDLKHLFVVQPAADEVTMLGMQEVPDDLADFNTYALVIECFVSADGSIEIEARYDGDVLPSAQIQRMLHQTEHIVRQLNEESSSTKLGAVEIFSAEDSRQVLEWNNTSPATAAMDCVHEIIMKQVLQQPDAMAVEAWDGKLTYRQLDLLSTRLAQHLSSLGVIQETFVPLMFDKSAWSAVSMLAVLKAGGAYVQLSPAHPIARIQGILSEVDAMVVLVAPRRKHIVEGLVPHVVSVEPSLFNSLPAAPSGVSYSVKPENVAFVVYTSGSTGRPKGVMIEHRGMCSMVRAQGRKMKFNNQTRTLQWASHTFDVSNSEVLTTLMHGGCVCVPSEHERMNDLSGVINRLGVNWLFLTPTVADMLDPTTVPTLRSLALGGEAIRQDLLDRWASTVCVLNSYGPSECSIWTSMSELRYGTNPSNIGYGLGCSLWIAEPFDHDRLTPVGCIGELLVEGPIVSRGYVKQPEKTRAAFITAPKWARAGGSAPRRFYKTGDLVRYVSDGTMEYVGRADGQVKWRGQRVELGEIEQTIKAHWSNVQVAVDIFSQGGRADKPAMGAFLDLSANEEVSEVSTLSMTEALQNQLQDLRSALTESLPSYMVPSHYIVLSKMATTMSGKTDRKALRQLASQISESELAAYALADVTKRAASTPAEKRLLALWVEILGISASSIGADDTFFQAGGDSIGAMKLATAAREAGLSLSVADIMRYPKLSKMAELLGDVEFTQTPIVALEPFSLLSTEVSLKEIAKMCKVSVETIEDVYPCTSLQENLMEISARQAGAYVAQNVFRLPETLDLGRFREAWESLVALHPILRTRIVHTAGGQSVQVVLKEKIHWSTVSAALTDYLNDDATADVRYGKPLSRFAVVKDQAAGCSYFVWIAQHSVYDGWSVDILFSQVQKAYEGLEVSKPAAFNTFVQHLLSSEPAVSEQYWISQLSEGRPLHFPPQLPFFGYQPRPNKLDTHTIILPSKASSGITMPTILQAAWAKVVSRYVESEDVVFGVALSGRDTSVAGIESIVGPTITTVPLRIQVKANQTITEYLENVQSQRAEMILHQHTGLAKISELPVAPGAVDLGHLLVVQPSTEESSESSLGLEPVEIEVLGFDNYALKLTCIMKDGQVILEAYYDEAAIPAADMQRMMFHFEHVVHQLMQQTTTKIEEVDLFGTHDLAQVLEWNREIPETVESCLHNLIGEQVALRPHARAVDAWDGQVTYRQLDQLSGRLANYLTTKYRVMPNEMVPLCFDKSIWAIIAMFAVIKAGGAIVPLNPDHPRNRIAGIVEDVGARLILAAPDHIGLVQGLAKDVLQVDPSTSSPLFGAHRRLSNTPVPTADDACFVVFTSGSTGKPKGIVLEHRAVCSSARAHGRAMRLGPASRVLQFAAYTFDVSLGEIFTTLMHGGCVCVPSEHDRMNDLAGVINRMEINWAYLTPTVASLIHPSEVPTLKTLSLGGEAVLKESVVTWADHVYLINIYGPAETTIWSTALTGLRSTERPANIGYGIGSWMWVVDQSDHNKLCPIGCVGEILIEGPILARGYINLPDKTAASFIEEPNWPNGLGKNKRLYKTGDLAKYNADGSLDIVGRRDTQLKLFGQRIELGEIEHNLSTNSYVRHAAVLYLKSKQQLVAIMSLRDIPLPLDNGSSVQLINKEQRSKADQEVTEIREYLSERVPRYMVPVIWLVVEAIPMTVSGKTNRLELTRWLEGLSEEDFHHALEGEVLDGSEVPTSSMEETIQGVISQVLNIPVVKLDKSFLKLGGDSITAMQVRTKCRQAGVTLTVQDILRSKSISDMALAAVPGRAAKSYQETFDTTFGLSPIQKMYFDLSPRGSTPRNYFHQSFLLRLTRNTEPSQIAQALEAVATQHSMLRARFFEVDDQWMQKVSGEVQGSYVFGVHELARRNQVTPFLAARHSQLDIQKGPVFGADLFNITADGEKHQLLFLVAHHLVIDMMSWRVIIQDLQSVLETGSLSAEKPMPFQQWRELQVEHAQKLGLQTAGIPTNIPSADLGYWAMEARANTFHDAVETSFTLDAETTSTLFGASNDALRTEPVDIILGAIMNSFGQVFDDRQVPTFFTEGHGREPWEADMDVSSVVGWFTTMSPVHIPSAGQDIMATLAQAKDLRKKNPDNGFAYFTSRYLNPEGREEFKKHSPMEVLFNYLGRAQQLENTDSLLQLEPWIKREASLDQGPDMRRMSLLEISAGVSNGELQVSITYNRHMQHLDRIKEWISQSERSLKYIANHLTTMQVQHTLSDLPLLPISQPELSLLDQSLSKLGLSPADVEDVYPLAPLQQRMLAYQQQSPETYMVQNVYDVTSTDPSVAVDIPRLRDAWQKVVDRHSVLRTIFIPSVSSIDGFYQAVERRSTARLVHIECDDEDLPKLQNQVNLDSTELRPHNRLTLFESTGGNVSVKLEVNHALIDGMSIRLIMNDLATAYENQLPTGSGPLYSDYIKLLQQQDTPAQKAYWASYLETLQPCHFLTPTPASAKDRQQRVIDINFDQDFERLQEFCQTYNVTLATVFQTVWGLVLRHYTGSDQVCYGYLTSGRDVAMEGVSEVVGTLINLLVCRLDIGENTDIVSLVEATRDDFFKSLPYQHGLVDALSDAPTPFFNTLMSLQYSGGSSAEDQASISFNHIGGQDPNEYDLSIGIGIGENAVQASLAYWATGPTDDEDAVNIADTFIKCVDWILENPEGKISQLKVSDASSGTMSPFEEIPEPLPKRASVAFDLPIVDEGGELSDFAAQIACNPKRMSRALNLPGSWRNSWIQ